MSVINKLVIAADCNALGMKKAILSFMAERHLDIEVIDILPHDNEDITLYPLIVKHACEKILSYHTDAVRGVFICGTGLGVSITANKFEGIYAALCHDMYSCERSILSNNANVICFGAQIISNDYALRMLEYWLSLEFAPGRSTPKVNAVKEIEAKNFGK